MADIAKYAASMAANYVGGSGHDGIGEMIESSWEKPDYTATLHQEIAVVTDDESDEGISKETVWGRACRPGWGTWVERRG